MRFPCTAVVPGALPTAVKSGGGAGIAQRHARGAGGEAGEQDEGPHEAMLPRPAAAPHLPVGHVTSRGEQH